MAAASEPFRLGYVLERYPNASETFIAAEMRAVAACGAEVTAFVLSRGPDGVDAGVRTARADQAGAADAADALGAVRLACGFGLGAPRALAGLLRRRRVLGFFVRRARELHVEHLHAHFAGLPTLMALAMAGELPEVSVSFAAHARDLYVRPKTIARKGRGARVCIACTEAGAGRLRALLRPADRPKVVRIYHGTDLARFAYRPRPQPGRPARILAVGRMVPKKGFDVLLHALRRLRTRCAVLCEIAGDGPLRAALEALARRLDLGDCVSFAGWLPHADMPERYHGADLLAVPSVRARDGDVDGLPNVAVEALACGTPVVAGAVGALPEAIRADQTGLLCPPGDPDALADAIERMLTDARLRARVTAAGRRLAEEQFDLHVNARTVHDVLRRAAT